MKNIRRGSITPSRCRLSSENKPAHAVSVPATSCKYLLFKKQERPEVHTSVPQPLGLGIVTLLAPSWISPTALFSCFALLSCPSFHESHFVELGRVKRLPKVSLTTLELSFFLDLSLTRDVPEPTGFQSSLKSLSVISVTVAFNPFQS